jgi:hypothetical protein
VSAGFRLWEQEVPGSNPGAPILHTTWIGCTYAALGEHDEALAWLKKAYAERDPQVLHFHWPVLDPLRAGPRFQALKNKMGLQ